MKTKKSERGRNLLASKKTSAILAVVCVMLLAFAVALILRLASPKKYPDAPAGSEADPETEDTLVREAAYFEDSPCPAYLSVEGSGIRIELDDADASDRQWEIESENEGIVSIEETGGERPGFFLRPLSPGYADLTITKSMEIGGETCPAVTVRMSVVVSENEYGSLETVLTDVQQELTQTGAADTEYPYLLDGDRILFPNGGDWIAEPEESAGGYYVLVSGGDVQSEYVQVLTQDTALDGMDEEALEEVLTAGILLTSSSLGRSERISVAYDVNGQLYLTAAEES